MLARSLAFRWVPVVAATAVAPALATNGTPFWTFSQVHPIETDTYFSTPNLAFDHYGTPAVSWSSISLVGAPNIVRHSTFTGLGLWSHLAVTSGVNVGLRTALAFDRAERPSVAWVNLDGSVRATFNNGASQSVAGPSSAAVPPVATLGYDLAGQLRGAFAAPTAGQFQSVGYAGNSFNSSAMTTFSGLNAVLDAAMTTDGRGLRQLAARVDLGGSQGLLLGSEPPTGGPWAQAIFAIADAIDGADIARDPADDRTAFAYTTFNSGTNTSKLFYAKFNGIGVQTTELLSSNTQRFEDVSLAFDGSDLRPAIAYERRITGSGASELWYGFLNASQTWAHGLVDGTVSLTAPNGAARKPSLAFDDFGTSFPAIAYVDADGSLRVAFDPPAPEPASAALLVAGLLLASNRCRRAGPPGLRSV